LTEQTRKLVGAAQFAQMKPTAFFINTARGPMVDEQALYQALSQNQIAGAGMLHVEQDELGARGLRRLREPWCEKLEGEQPEGVFASRQFGFQGIGEHGWAL
jgi:lactate dehydrogenase-like 2-hydroxyacid dehydrogenase